MRQSLVYDEDVGEFSAPSATNETLTCDLLVAGGGLSGLSAADSAIRRGLNVVVIEKGVYGQDAASGLNAGQFLTGWASRWTSWSWSWRNKTCNGAYTAI